MQWLKSNKGLHPMSKWSSEKRKSMSYSLLMSLNNPWLWCVIRFGVDSHTLLVYTSLYSGYHMFTLMKDFKLGKDRL